VVLALLTLCSLVADQVEGSGRSDIGGAQLPAYETTIPPSAPAEEAPAVLTDRHLALSDDGEDQADGDAEQSNEESQDTGAADSLSEIDAEGAGTSVPVSKVEHEPGLDPQEEPVARSPDSDEEAPGSVEPGWSAQATASGQSATAQNCGVIDSTIYADQSAGFALEEKYGFFPPYGVQYRRFIRIRDAVDCASASETVYLCPGYYPAVGIYKEPVILRASQDEDVCVAGDAVLGALPEPKGNASRAGGDRLTPCVSGVKEAFENLTAASTPYAFRLAGHPPPQFEPKLTLLAWLDEDILHGHWQGVQRLSAGGGRYLVVSRDKIQYPGDEWSGYAIVHGGQVVETFHIEKETRQRHPGGIQVMGDIMALSLAPDSGSSPPIIHLVDLSDPEHPDDPYDAPIQPLATRAEGNKGSLTALTQLQDRHYLLLVAKSGAPVDFYISDEPDSLRSFWFADRWPNAGLEPDKALRYEPGRNFEFGWEGHQSINLVTECGSGDLYLIGTGNLPEDWTPHLFGNYPPVGEDWASLYKLERLGNDFTLEKVRELKFPAHRDWLKDGLYELFDILPGTEWLETAVWILEDEEANFDAAAGIYVDAAPNSQLPVKRANRLYLWSTQHGWFADIWGEKYSNVTEYGPPGGPPVELAGPPLTWLNLGPKAIEIVVDGVNYVVEKGKEVGVRIYRAVEEEVYEQVEQEFNSHSIWDWFPPIFPWGQTAGEGSWAQQAITIGTTVHYTATLVDSDGNEGPPSDVFSATVGMVQLAIPDVYGPEGESVRVPVNVASAEGLEMCDVDLRLAYNPLVLAATGVSETPLTAGYEWASQVISPGLVQAVISATVGETLHGGGALFDVVFDVTGQEGSASDLSFELTGSRFIDCEYPSTPLLLDLDATGTFTVQASYIAGDLNGDGAADTTDADLALQIAVGANEPTEEQMAAGDLNGDGWISAADAVLIMRMAAGLPLVPASTGLVSRSATQSDSVVISAPGDGQVSQGGSAWVPLTIDNASGLAGADLRLSYDPYIITAVDARTTALSANYDLAFHEAISGQLRISLKPKVGYEDGLPGGSGPLVEIQFQDRALAQGNAMTLLNPVAVRLSDPYGRDFANSALQVEIQMISGALIVEDVVPPRVAVFHPYNGAHFVELDEPVYVRFNEAMSQTTLVLDLAPGLDLTEEWNDFGTEVVMDHPDFAEETTYTVTVMAHDMAGIPMTQTVTWSFTTTVADNTPPAVLSVSPPDGAADVEQDTPIVITFSEEIYLYSLHLTLAVPPYWGIRRLDTTANMTGTVVSATLPSLPYPQATCALTVTAKDRAGNPLPEPYTWTFTTLAEQHRIYLPLVVRDQ
jgi:hypothetical protein